MEFNAREHVYNIADAWNTQNKDRKVSNRDMLRIIETIDVYKSFHLKGEYGYNQFDFNSENIAEIVNKNNIRHLTIDILDRCGDGWSYSIWKDIPPISGLIDWYKGKCEGCNVDFDSLDIYSIVKDVLLRNSHRHVTLNEACFEAGVLLTKKLDRVK